MTKLNSNQFVTCAWSDCNSTKTEWRELGERIRVRTCKKHAKYCGNAKYSNYITERRNEQEMYKPDGKRRCPFCAKIKRSDFMQAHIDRKHPKFSTTLLAQLTPQGKK